MEPPTEPSVTELEEAMRQALFLSSPPTRLEADTGDPPISIPDAELIWEEKLSRVEGPLMSEIAAKYPSLFSASRGLGMGDHDPLKSVFRNPEGTERFFRS